MKLPKICSDAITIEQYESLARNARGQEVCYKGVQWYVDGVVWISSSGAMLWNAFVVRMIKTRQTYELMEVETALREAAKKAREEPRFSSKKEFLEWKKRDGKVDLAREEKATALSVKLLDDSMNMDFPRNGTSSMPKDRFGISSQSDDTPSSAKRKDGRVSRF